MGNTDAIEFKFTRTKPRKGATNKVYIFNTVEDIIMALNKDNYKRFLSDFKSCLEKQNAKYNFEVQKMAIQLL